MRKIHSFLLLISLFILTITTQTNAQIFNSTFDCAVVCAMPITWDTPITACGQDMNNYVNMFCDTGLCTNLECMVKSNGPPDPNIGISYPGPCGCPNNCVNGMGRGQCVNGACQCNSGWAADCSIVTSSNGCSGRGKVQNVLGFNTCVCNSQSYALNDCSANVGAVPMLAQTITPAQQYSDWDKYGNNHPIFNDSTIAQIHLTMPPEFLEYQLDPNNHETEEYLPVSMWFYNGVISETLEKVGFRIKGGVSRNYVKKTFKLSFNTFEDGRKWYQQKKLELKSMQQDPSAIKEKLCLNMLYSLNAPAQRAAYTQLFINNQFMGMYLMLENIDDQFLKSRFGNEDGALFKCVGDLAYLGWDPALYVNATNNIFDATAYEPKTDLADTSFDKIRDLTYVINVTSDSDFVNMLPEIFDIDLYARTLAMEVLTGNFDGLWNTNNYYLYFNPPDNKFLYLRHDLELAFGMWETFFPMESRSVYTWGTGGFGYRLIDRFLSVEPFRSLFTQYCYQSLDTFFYIGGSLLTQMEFLNLELQPAILPDIWRQTDMGYSFDEFKMFPDQGIVRVTGGNYSQYGLTEVRNTGIKEFMTVRINSLLQQLEPRK